MEEKDQYIIRQETMALLPCDAEDGSLKTFVVEENKTILIAKTPFEIIRDSCNYFGVTYSGRKKGAVAMGYKSMPPICICSELGIYFFPLMSELHRNCIWLAHPHCRNYTETDNGVLVHLTHGYKIRIPVNLNVFKAKVHRTAQYSYQMLGRVSQFRSAGYGSAVSEEQSASRLMVNERGTYYID
ncbi:competence transcription factor (CTF) [Sporolactobacillus shoreae]|uniref:Competence transcription factor (CTF) n=1 Tax=Sporolactobacillus shoreae TaxID=1465501 RepID=A0A4Z0GL96_9BACL|nr:competence protein ComK [Sporolactobacillus shoreae]TGA97505.1 competence transcription factor (CTF) [Sporolactobacillus shoreae]